MTDIKKKSAPDLVKHLEEKREDLRAIRFDLAGTKTKNTMSRKELRKEVARTLTELNARKNATV